MAAMAEDGWLMLGAGETVIVRRPGRRRIHGRGLYRLIGDGSRVEKRHSERRSAGLGLNRRPVVVRHLQ